MLLAQQYRSQQIVTMHISSAMHELSVYESANGKRYLHQKVARMQASYAQYKLVKFIFVVMSTRNLPRYTFYITL